MQGLSFREYLLIQYDISAAVFSLDDIVHNKVSIPELPHPLPVFREEPGFDLRINQIVQQTIESDISQYADLKPATARKLKQLLGVVAGLAPYKPNFDNLSKEVGVSKNNVPDYLTYLERAELLGMLRDDTSGMRQLGKIEKIYIDNPSLMTVLAAGNPDISNLRETFFFNQMRLRNKLVSSKVSDFFIAPYTFEVGGKGKGARQIESVSNGRERGLDK